MSETDTATHPPAAGAAGTDENRTLSHRSPQPTAPAAAAPAPSQVPPQAPPMPAAPPTPAPSSATPQPVELIVRDAEEETGTASQQRERQAAQPAGIPGGPLALSFVNGVGLAGTSAYYAAGIAGAVILGGATAAAGAGVVALQSRRRYGLGRGLRMGRYGRGVLRSGGIGRGATGSPSAGIGTARRRGAGGGSAAGGGRSRALGGRRGAAPASGTGGAAAGVRRSLHRPSSRAAGGTGAGTGRTAGPTSLTKSPLTKSPRTGGGTTGGGTTGGGRGGLLQRLAGRGRAGGGGASPTGRTRPLSGVGGGLSRGVSRAARHLGPSSRAGQTVAAGARRAGRMVKRLGGALDRARKQFPAWVGAAGRGIAKRWKTGEKRRRLWRQHLRMARRISGTALLATLGAVLGQIAWPFRWHAARTWTRIWNWRAHRAQVKEDAIDAKNAAKDAKTRRAPVRDKVNDPGRHQDDTRTTAAPARGQGGTDVQVFARAAEQVQAAYARYSPPNMMSVAAEYDGVPEGIQYAAQAIAHLVRNTREVYPAHEAVAEAVSAVYMRMMEAAKLAEEISPHFRKVHEDDIARHEAPRNGWSGEVMWNIGGRPGGGEAKPSVFLRSAEQVATVYHQWQPQVMTQVAAEYESLPTGIEHLASAVESLARQSADSFPVDPSVAEMVSAVRHRLMKAVSAAQEVMPLFRRVHAKDLARHEAPRNGPAAEAMWNV
ncbi:hypothetical protein TPA0909_60600 [Streptomyces albus]|nr:hypothetical protein TPA0909_60600 [Streptomyces albus]